MSDVPILLVGCDDVDCWPCLLPLAHDDALTTLGVPGAVIPPAELASPVRRQIERMVTERGVRDIVLVGHTDCRALRSVFLGDARAAEGELADWLVQVGLTKEALRVSYPDCEGQRLLDVAVQECLLAQPERLMAIPALREAAEKGEVHVELWVFDAETRQVLVFDPDSGQFEPRRPRLTGCELPEHAGHAH